MIGDIFSLLLEVAAGFITALLLLRAHMRWLHISFFNPFGQFIAAATNWVVMPVQRIIRSKGKFDLVSVLLAWIIQVLLIVLLFLLSGWSIANSITTLPVLLALGTLQLLKAALYLLMAMAIFSALLSWINPFAPIAPLVYSMTAPFLQPIRRILPTLGGVDLSPLMLLLAAQILLMIIGNLHMQLFRFLL